jgi:hypothetical protein
VKIRKGIENAVFFMLNTLAIKLNLMPEFFHLLGRAKVRLLCFGVKNERARRAGMTAAQAAAIASRTAIFPYLPGVEAGRSAR